MKRSYALCAGLTGLTLAMVFGQMASAQTTWYVATNGTGDGSSWPNAIDNIQGAISKATTANDIVLVSNGVYETGGVMNYPSGTFLTNRIAITNAIIVRSANNDPTNTIIKGAADNGTNGPSSVRCVYMTDGSSLIGFTLTNGATMLIGTNVVNDCSGGGVWCPSTNTTISNCVIAGNMASTNGGGAYYGTLYNCTLATNQLISISGKATGGGGACNSTLYNCLLTQNQGMSGLGTCYGGAANASKLYNCTLSGGYASYGGGAYNSTLYSCTIVSNSLGGGNGAGTRACTLYNCLLMGNSGGGSASYGGGAHQGTLYNCTVVGNSASYGGGTSSNKLINCIVYFNTASMSGSNWYNLIVSTNSCTAPEATGIGNITADPMFADTNALNYRLGSNSPCINTGSNYSWMTDSSDAGSKDLDVYPRILGPSVDMGAYECWRGEMSVLPSAVTNAVLTDHSASTPITISATNYDLYWYAVITSSWVSASSTGGYLAAGSSETVSFTNNSSGLTGRWSSIVQIMATNYPNYNTVTGSVLMVLDVIGFTVSPTNLTNSAQTGFNATNQSFTITSFGQGSFNYAITTNGLVDWLVVSNGVGSITDSATNEVVLIYASSNLSSGVRTGTLAVATFDGGGQTQLVEVTLTVAKADQAITDFPNPGDQITTNTVGLWAKASSELDVTNFAVISGPGVISDLTNLTFTTLGSVSVTADQPGNNSWNAAPTVTNTFNITKATVLVTLHNLTQTYNGSARVVTATTEPDGLTVNITYDGNSWSPTNPGTYAVTGMVNDAVYQGTMNGTLTVVLSGVTASKGAYSDKVLVYWDALSSAISYKVWRGTNSNVQMASVLGTCTASFYLDTSTTPDILYYYWLEVVYASGASVLSLPDSGYCGSIANLTSPTGVQASDGSYTDRIQIMWQAVSNATRYEVWRNTENDLATASLISEQTEINYDDLSVDQGVYYYYWLKAGTAHRDGNFGEPDAGWRRLSTPAGVSASNGIYPYHIRVAWNAVANAAAYEVWREEVPGINSTGGVNLVMVAQTNGVYLDDYLTKSGVCYRYKVKAFNELSSSLDYGHGTGYRLVNSASTLLPVINDYDGDKLSDLALFNPVSGGLDVLCSAFGRQTFILGAGHSQGVTGDYDGDRVADPVAYCPDSGTWLARLSSIGYNPIIRAVFSPGRSASAEPGGGNGNYPAAADFDGDRLADVGVYNETDGALSVILSNNGAFDIRASCLIGGPGYRFVSADFDGDWLADPAVYSESEGRLAVIFSASGYSSVNVALGGPGRSMFAADFDGDRLADPALYEEAPGMWIVLLSSAGYSEVKILFGGPGYVPVSGDYDGDGLADPAIYRETNGQWLIMFSASGYSVIAETFGGPECQPVAK